MRRGLNNLTLTLFAALAATFTVAAADEAASPPGGSDAAALFKQLDANADGQLTSDEAGGDKERLFKRLLRTSDKDSNSQLSAEEFAAGLAGDRSKTADVPQAAPAGTQRAPGPGPGAMFRRLDANGDGKVVVDELPAERREFFARMLKRLDADGDGALNREELAKAGPPGGAAMIRSPAGAIRLVSALDSNGDGDLSAEEIGAAAESLKKLDNDGDGSVSRQELGEPKPDRAASNGGTPPEAVDQLVRRALAADQNSDSLLSPQEAPQKLQKAFAKIDANGDGQLDAGELKARFVSAQKRQQAKPDKAKKNNKKPD